MRVFVGFAIVMLVLAGVGLMLPTLGTPARVILRYERRDRLTEIAESIFLKSEAKSEIPSFLFSESKNSSANWRLEFLAVCKGDSSIWSKYHRNKKWNDPINQSVIKDIPECFEKPGYVDPGGTKKVFEFRKK